MAGDEVVGDNAPIEFTYQGRRFRIHRILSRWRTAGGWWNRLNDHASEVHQWRPDDGVRSSWKVEAAPVGAVGTFELERDETTGQWIIRHI